MSKKIYLLSLATAMLLVACSKNDTVAISPRDSKSKDAVAPEPEPEPAPVPEPVPAPPTPPEDTDRIDQYIVVLKKGAVQNSLQMQRGSLSGIVAKQISVAARMNNLMKVYSLKPAIQTFSMGLQGGVYELTGEQASQLKENPTIAYVEKDQWISIRNEQELQANTVQSNVTWGLDRLDQANLPLNQTYNYVTSGVQVNAYIIDTGVLINHTDFQGRTLSGTDLVDKDNDATDCNGHGTHVAGTIGSATYGVAKNVKLHAVRVLNCAGSGRFSDVIAGIEWVTANHVKPAVVNMSLGGAASQAVDDAVSASIQAGVTYVVAAGNDNQNACNSSPARVADAITVGSTMSSDARSDFSNFGNCVDVFAPGSDIKSLWYNSNSATNTISGTSMASPHVAGVAALYLAKNPNAQPAQVAAALVANALNGKISSAGSGSPNKLVNTLFLAANDDTDSGDGDDGTQPLPDENLKNGSTIANLNGPRGEEKVFKLHVPANSANLNIDIFNGTGDSDLYVKFGDKPSTTAYDCRPYKNGNFENCKITSPQAGTWYVILRGYSSYEGVSLKVTFETAVQDNSPCAGCVKYEGELKQIGAENFHPNGTHYVNTTGTQQIWLQGPDQTDFDLYLYKQNGTNWVLAASAMKLNSVEQINYSGVAGNYRIKVKSYNGTGAYRVWRK